MGLRERQQLGELRRQIVNLEARLAQADARIKELESVAGGEAVRALERENARLSASLADLGQANEQLRKSLKNAHDERTWLEAHLQSRPGKRNPNDELLAFFRAAPGLSTAARAHLCMLLDLVGEPGDSLGVKESLAAMVGAFIHGWTLSPGTCYDLARALQTYHSSFFGWLLKHSSLISKKGNAENNLVIYELHLERLGWEEIPPVPGRAPWLDGRGRVRLSP